MKRQRFPVILSEYERQLVSKLADMEGGLSGAALLRRLIRKEAQLLGIRFPGSCPGGPAGQEAESGRRDG